MTDLARIVYLTRQFKESLNRKSSLGGIAMLTREFREAIRKNPQTKPTQSNKGATQ